MPDFTKVRYTIAVPDLAKSTNYYTSVLGLSIDFTAPGWTFLSRGSFRVMLGECTDAIPPAELGDHSWYGYVAVTDASALFAEYRASGLRFTLVSPGPTDTAAWDAVDPDSRPGFTPRARMLRPEDVAAAVVFAATRPPHVQLDWLRLGPA